MNIEIRVAEVAVLEKMIQAKIELPAVKPKVQEHSFTRIEDYGPLGGSRTRWFKVSDNAVVLSGILGSNGKPRHFQFALWESDQRPGSVFIHGSFVCD